MSAKAIIEKVTGYQALGSRIVVRRLDPGDKSEGGLYIPEAAREHRRLAEVVSVGPGKMRDNGTRIPPEVKPGDLVLTVKFKGVDIECGDETLQILDESDCMVKVEVSDDG